MCIPRAPLDPEDARGHTWTGTVSSIDRGSVWFEVDAVYAHDPDKRFPNRAVLEAGERLRVRSDCRKPKDMGFEVGRRYLVSTGAVWPGGIVPRSETVAWQITGSSADFLGEMSPGARVWRGFRQATTLAAALATVAPGVPPATDAPGAAWSSGQAVDPRPAHGLLAWVLISGLLALFARRRRQPARR